MNFIFILLIFCLVLFFYLHIYFQLKTSDDLEIYEIENPSKERLEEICDLRQPCRRLLTRELSDEPQPDTLFDGPRWQAFGAYARRRSQYRRQ